jgi:hypothetical protein
MKGDDTTEEEDFEKYQDREDKLFDNLLGDGPSDAGDADEGEAADDAGDSDAGDADEGEAADDAGDSDAGDAADADNGDDDEDYDKPVKGKEKSKNEEDLDPEREPKDETAARQQAKENGRKLKAAEARNKEIELELERVRQEAIEAKKAAEEVRRIRIKPMEDPAYRELHDEILSEVNEEAELLTGARNVPKFFGELSTDYLAAATHKDGREAAIRDLRSKIIEKCIQGDTAYEDLDDIEREKVDAAATGVLKILRSTAPRVKKALELAQTLTEGGEEAELNVKQRDYERTVGSVKPVLKDLGTMADDLIEQAPFTPEAIVAKLVKESPEAQRRSERLKTDIEEVFAGVRPLTKEEVRKLRSEGTDLKEFERQRAKAHEGKRQKFMAYLYHGVMTRAMLPEMAKELAELRGEKDAEASEADALRDVLKKKPGAKKEIVIPDKGEKPVSAGRRRNLALDDMLGSKDPLDDSDL